MTIIVALILFIFAITSGSESGWATAQVLAPLIISIFMLTGFFLWERQIPQDIAAVYVSSHLDPFSTLSRVLFLR